MPIDPLYGIFYENQCGGLCRLHSLNAFFEGSKLSQDDFQRYISIYDQYIKTRFNIETSSASFDLISSDQTTLVSFILKHFKVHTRYYALNTIYGKNLDADITTADFIFIFNSNHIWGIRKKDGTHYTVDSMSGVRPFNINSLRDIKDIGLLVPVSLKKEWEKQIHNINDILDKNIIKNKQQLCEYLIRLHDDKKILGDLEIPIGVSISILETNIRGLSGVEFKKIDDLIKKYNLFITTFTRGNYNNIQLILDNIPDIIFDLMSLQKL